MNCNNYYVHCALPFLFSHLQIFSVRLTNSLCFNQFNTSFLKVFRSIFLYKEIAVEQAKRIYFNILEISEIVLKENKALHILRNGTTEYLISRKMY